MADNKKETTLRCVGVLVIIALICGLLLAVLNPLLYVAPSVDELADKFSKEVEGEWTIEDINSEFSSGEKTSVMMVAKAKGKDGKDYTGISIKALKNGKMDECSFAIFFDDASDSIVEAYYIKNNATDGYKYDNVINAAKEEGNTQVLDLVKEGFAQYLNTPITAENACAKFPEGIKTGATFTVKSASYAFNLAANYYYNVFVKGGAQA